jgi:cytoskeletal protein CcmA (bactofilin family)
VLKSGNRAGQTAVDIDSRIDGDIRFVGIAVIDGYVNGTITAGQDDNATLTINENGYVNGSVAAPHLLINGIVEGEVRATERLTLGPMARVSGVIHYNLIEISIGAQIDGELIYNNEGSIVQEDTKTEAGQIEDKPHCKTLKSI